MILKWSLLITCACLGTLDAAFVDTLHKCSTKDGKCLTGLIQNILKDIGEDGIKEYNIPPINPIKFDTLKVKVLNLVNITLNDLVIKGLQDCVIVRADVPVEKGQATFEMICDLVAKGKHKVTGSSPLLQNLFGSESISSDGKFKLKLTKLHLTVYFFYNIIRKPDGEVYFKCKRDQFRYKYDIKDLNIAADNIFLGRNDASKVIVEFLNQNWQLVLQAVGDEFLTLGTGIFNDILHRFFDNTPIKHYISEDLSYLIKNN